MSQKLRLHGDFANYIASQVPPFSRCIFKECLYLVDIKVNNQEIETGFHLH